MNHIKLSTLLLVLTLACCRIGSAQDVSCVNFDDGYWYLENRVDIPLYDQPWSMYPSANCVSVRNDLAYVTSYENEFYTTSFDVYDVSDPMDPHHLSRTIGLSSIIRATDNIMFGDLVICGWNLIDVSDPAVPVVLSRLAEYENIKAVESGIGYATGRDFGFKTIDLTEPDNPTVLGEVETGTSTWDCAVSGSYAVVSVVGFGLWVIDVSDPTEPTVAGSLEFDSEIVALDVSGHQAFVGRHSYGSSEHDFDVVDFSDPTNPVLLGSLSQGIRIWGEPLYTAGKLEVVDGLAFLAGSGLQAIDVSDPHSPVYKGRIFEVCINFDVDQNHLLSVHGASGFDIACLGRPGPAEISFVDIHGSEDVVVTDEGIAYVSTYESSIHIEGATLEIVDVTDPLAPVRIGNIDMPSDVDKILLLGDYLYVASFHLSWFYVVDITSQTQPQHVASQSLPHRVLDMETTGDLTYISAGAAGLLIMDTSAPESSRLVGSLYLSDFFAYQLEHLGDQVFMISHGGSSSGELLKVDVSDATDPQLLSRTQMNGKLGDLVLDDGFAYVAGQYGLAVMDLSGPGEPTEVAFLGSEEGIRVIARTQYTLYMAQYDNRATVVDISDPYDPRYVGSQWVMQGTDDIIVDRDHLVSLNYGGLEFCRLHCEDPVNLEGGLPGGDPDTPICMQSRLAVHPNPFNPKTVVSFSIDRPQILTIAVYDVTGRCVATLARGAYPAGPHTLQWNGTDHDDGAVASGTYFLRVVGDYTDMTTKMALIR